MTRRDLIQKVLIGGTTLIVLPSVLSSCSKDENEDNNNNNGTGENNDLILDLTKAAYAPLNTVGGSVIVQNIIVAYTSTGYVALSSICTHEGCTITYSSTSNNFPCPCHGSLYSVTGSVLNGPTTVALKSYPVSKSGDILTISL